MILMLGSFNLGSDQSLPPELAKHDPLDRPQVIIGASITVCDLVYVLSTKCPRSVRRGGGEGIDDLMVLLRKSHRLPKVANHYSNWLRLPPARCLYTITYHRHNVEDADAL